MKIRLWILRNTPLVLFCIIFIIFGLFSPKFFRYQNFENIATQASYVGILAVGMTFVLLTAGIDLSIGANMYLSAATAGLLIENYGAPVWLALLAAVVVGMLFGAFNAFVVIKLKIIPFLVTLSTLIAGRGLCLFLTKSRSVPLPESILHIGSARILGIPLPIIMFTIVVCVAQIFLKRTPLGREIYAVGNDVDEAKKAGLKPSRVYATVYIACGFLAAIGGIISVAQQGIINSGFGEGVEFQAVAATVLGGASLYGGIGSAFPGVVIGAVLVQMVQAGLVYLQVDLYSQPLISAGIIFLAVFVDSVRNARLAKIERRNIRTEA